MTIKIKKNVELPPHKRGLYGGRKFKYPFPDMEVGDMFAVPGGEKTRNSLSSCAKGYAKRHNPSAKFATRELDDGTVGVWRVA